MSKSSIGLDNPTFNGNLRVYRRRHVVEPRKPAKKPVGLLGGTNSNLAQPKTHSIPPKVNNQKSPLTLPAKPKRLAGSEPYEISKKPKYVKKPTTPNVGGSFEQWQQQQINSFRKKSHNSSQPIRGSRTSVPNRMQQAQEDVVEDTAKPVRKSRIRSLLRKVPFYGNLTRKDILTMKFALPTMAVVIFLFGCGVAVQGIFTNKHVKAQVAEASNNGVTGYDPSGQGEVPDETVPDESWGPYIVAPNMPRYIKINKINVFARVTRVGVKPNNELIAPNNIHTVGWYEGSALPGEKGAALMDAHVHGPTMPGAFYNVHKLSAGDEIEIEMGDGRNFVYNVVGTDKYGYDNTDMAKAMKPIEEGKKGLNLITCGGKYNRDLKMYEERVVVYAVQK